MNEDKLQSLILSWENLNLVVRHISDHPEHLDVLMKIALDDSQPQNWRAIWMVDKIHEKHPELVWPYLESMTNFLLTTQNSSKKRHLLKLISLNTLQEDKLGHLLNRCIDIFSNSAEPVAVRVHAMQVLFNIAQKEPDFSGELIELIEHEMEYHGSAGIASRGKKILRKLRSKKNKTEQASSRLTN